MKIDGEKVSPGTGVSKNERFQQKKHENSKFRLCEHVNGLAFGSRPYCPAPEMGFPQQKLANSAEWAALVGVASAFAGPKFVVLGAVGTYAMQQSNNSSFQFTAAGQGLYSFGAGGAAIGGAATQPPLNIVPSFGTGGGNIDKIYKAYHDYLFDPPIDEPVPDHVMTVPGPTRSTRGKTATASLPGHGYPGVQQNFRKNDRNWLQIRFDARYRTSGTYKAHYWMTQKGHYQDYDTVEWRRYWRLGGIDLNEAQARMTDWEINIIRFEIEQ